MMLSPKGRKHRFRCGVELDIHKEGNHSNDYKALATSKLCMDELKNSDTQAICAMAAGAKEERPSRSMMSKRAPSSSCRICPRETKIWYVYSVTNPDQYVFPGHGHLVKTDGATVIGFKPHISDVHLRIIPANEEHIRKDANECEE